MTHTHAPGQLPLDAIVHLRLLPDLAQLPEGLELGRGLRQPPAPSLHGQPQGLLGAGGELEAGRGPGQRGGAQAEEGRGEQILDTGQLARLQDLGREDAEQNRAWEREVSKLLRDE